MITVSIHSDYEAVNAMKHNVISFLSIAIVLGTSTTGWTDNGVCVECSRYVEVNRLKARCFQNRLEKDALLKQFEAEGVVRVAVDFSCLKRRNVTTGLSGNAGENPNLHYLDKNSIECLERLISKDFDSFNPSRVVSFEADCDE